jgi:predicted small metal-binding protein
MVTTVLDCECGFEASAEDTGGLVAEIRRHAREAHGMTLSVREAMRLASRAVAIESSGRGSHRGAGIRQKEER